MMDRRTLGTLQANPHSFFSWDFTVLRAGATIAEVDMAWVRERAEFEVADRTYHVHRESLTQGIFVLRSADQVLARARKVSPFSRAFEIEYQGRKLRLRAASVLRREFELLENDARIGRIGPTSWVGRKAVIDLPDEIPIPVQVFLFWLVAVLWRRAAGAATSS